MFITNNQRDQVLSILYTEKGIKLDPDKVTILSITAGNSIVEVRWLDQDGKQRETDLSIRDVSDVVKINLTLSTKVLTWDAILKKLHEVTGVKLIDTDVDPSSTDVTNLVFPATPGIIGTVFLHMSPLSNFFKGSVSLVLSSEDDPSQSPTGTTSKKHSTPFVMLGYTNVAPEDTIEVLNVDGSTYDNFTSLYNLVTANVWTVEQIEKVAEDKVVLIGTFDVEFVNSSGNLEAVTNGTMVMVDSTGRIVSIDTTPRGVTRVHILWHPSFDKFVMAYNVAGNFTVFKLYDYDLALAPTTSTLPVGPMTSAVIDAIGSIHVASGPIVGPTLSSSISRITLQPTGFYITDPVFATVTIADLINPNETGVVVSMVLLGSTLYARFTPVTSPSGMPFNPVVNGSNIRQPPIVDNDLAFGYSPVIPINAADGAVDPNLNIASFNYSQTALDTTVFRSATGVVIDPMTTPYRDVAISYADVVTTIAPVNGLDGRSKHQLFATEKPYDRPRPLLDPHELPTMVLGRSDVDNFIAILAYNDTIVTAPLGYDIAEYLSVLTVDMSRHETVEIRLHKVNPPDEVTIHLMKEYPL